MPGEKSRYESVPIPTYEEATSSRPTSTAPERPDQPSDESERQGLLGLADGHGRIPIPTRRAGYRPPASENAGSPRASEEREGFLEGEDGRGSEDSETAQVRQEMEEMEIHDPSSPSPWSKRITNLSRSISSISRRLPRFRLRLPELNLNLVLIAARALALILIIATVYLLFVSDIFTGVAQRMAAEMYDPERVKDYAQGIVDEFNIRKYLRHLTSYDHIAGTEGDYTLARYVEGLFVGAGLENVRMDQYDVYLNYPKPDGRKVQIVNPDGSVVWSAKLEEEQVYTDPPKQQSLVFHGHSKSGDVTGPLIYANYGSRKDFKRLYDSGIETSGAIALVRYYGSQGDRALKIKAAELAGFAGCIIYSDPAEDGFAKGEPWPNGRFMPSDGVQRGGVSLMSWVLGDVLTPGWASKPGLPRMSKENNLGLNKIPSIPLSWRDAQPLLQALKGYGQPLPEEWHGAVPDVEWWSGNLSSPLVRLVNEQDEIDKQPIWNVMGEIAGIEQGEKAIIVGNHRDAWTFGAADPGSGTAVFLEVVRIFGNLRAQNWRPLRTIQFASWDGEEYNLIGSTEYVENNIEELRKNGYAYLNVDVAVSGDSFMAAGSPVMRKALQHSLTRTSHPGQNKTMWEVWEQTNSKLQNLGAGSDYVAFQDVAGTSSFHMGFVGETYPYHSVYDNFEWMERYGDPGFQYHKVLAQIWVLMILELSDKMLMPFDIGFYATSVSKYVQDLDAWVENKGANQAGHTEFSTEPLREVAIEFQKVSKQFEKFGMDWEAIVHSMPRFESQRLATHRMHHNNRMANFDTELLDLEKGGGLPGRDQFKHVLYAPQKWSGYDEGVFPFIIDAVEDGDWDAAQKAVNKTANILRKAVNNLVHISTEEQSDSR